jgi:L-iditol 2-dehydrogenase
MATAMKVAMYYSNDDVRVQEMPIPEIGPCEMLVKVRSSGICGSDVMEWYRIKKAPLVLGHEIAGKIVKVGKKVKRYKVGQRVFVSHHVPCDECKYCRKGHHTVCDMLRSTNFYPGGFAEFVRVPDVNVDRGVYVLPDEVSYDEGAFVEPLACVVRAHRLTGFRSKESYLVVGSGIAGALHIALAKANGASKIIAADISKFRLDLAAKLGADKVIMSGPDLRDRVIEANDGSLVDNVIICTGNKIAIEQSLRCVDRGGRVLFFAPTNPGTEISIPFNDLWREEVTLCSSYGAFKQEINEAIELLRTKRIDVKLTITHRFPIERVGDGFKLVASAGDSLKVIIYF